MRIHLNAVRPFIVVKKKANCRSRILTVILECVEDIQINNKMLIAFATISPDTAAR